jgi:hypothetical protein
MRSKKRRKKTMANKRKAPSASKRGVPHTSLSVNRAAVEGEKKAAPLLASASAEQGPPKNITNFNFVNNGVNQPNCVLVTCKGLPTSYKATILNHCLKAGKYEFKIYYDGNKNSTVHLIPVDHVTKISWRMMRILHW